MKPFFNLPIIAIPCMTGMFINSMRIQEGWGK